jgi:amino acid transporter
MEKQGQMSILTAVLMSINIMVGIGIFIVPTLMAEQAGTLSFLGWPLVGIVFLPVVYSIAQITKLFPGKGSFFSYSEKTINKTAGFISGWFYFLGFSAVTAIQVLGLKDVLINQFGVFILRSNVILFNILFSIIFALICLMSLYVINKLQNTVTILKLLPLIFVISIFVFYWNPNLQFSWGNLSTLKFTLPLTLYGFWGFETSCNIGHMIKGDKNAPSRVMLISFFSAIAIYSLFHFGLLHIMNVENLISYKAPGFVQFLNIQNPFFFNLISSFMSSIILITFISAIFGGMLSNSANLYSMIEHNLFPFSNALKKTNRYHRPKYAIWANAFAIFALMTVINNQVILNSLCNFGLLTAFSLTLISLFLIQNKKGLFTQKIITSIAFVSIGIITYYSWILVGDNNLQRITYTLPLIILGAIGIGLFKLNEQNNKKNLE